MPIAPEDTKIEYDTSDTGDDFKNGYFAVKLSELAYMSRSQIEDALRALGYKGPPPIYFETQLTFGFITHWGNLVAVAFRGSSNRHEWLNNLKFWFAHTPYGRIHAGFYQTIEEVGPIVMQKIAPALLSGSNIVVVGHSRGGALAAGRRATVFGLDLASTGMFAAPPEPLAGSEDGRFFGASPS